MNYIEDDFNLEEITRNPVRKPNNTKINLKIIIVLSIILFLCMAYLAYLLIERRNEKERAMQINETTQTIIRPTPIPTEAPPPPEADDIDVVDIDESIADTTLEEPKHLLEQIVSLRETFNNDDIIGWLTIEDTAIDYMVAQSSDNDYYLRRDINGEKSSAGTLFMDYENNAYDSNRNTIIYGHNMRDGSMFHNLRYYTDRQYYEEHRYISLITPYEETIWEVFAFYETSTDFYYIQAIFPDDDAFLSLLSEIKKKSLYDTGVDVTQDDQILTLSTCANSANDTRYALHAKLLR